MKDLVVENDRGEQENCGAIAKKRTIGSTVVYLTYDEPSSFWWIIWKDPIDGCMRKIGFVEDRREVCWQMFRDLTESELAKLRNN